MFLVFIFIDVLISDKSYRFMSVIDLFFTLCFCQTVSFSIKWTFYGIFAVPFSSLHENKLVLRIKVRECITVEIFVRVMRCKYTNLLSTLKKRGFFILRSDHTLRPIGCGIIMRQNLTSVQKDVKPVHWMLSFGRRPYHMPLPYRRQKKEGFFSPLYFFFSLFLAGQLQNITQFNGCFLCVDFF